jgi:hypothetical protein
VYKKWIKQADKQGWRQKKIKNGVLLIPPQGDPVPLHNHHTRNEGANMRGLKAQLKRAGLDV